MKRRALLLFLPHQQNIEEIIVSGKYLENYFNFEIIPVYIRNINIYIPPTFLFRDSLGGGLIDKKLEGLEDIHIEKVCELLDSYEIETPLAIDIGFPEQIFLEYLKTTDLLILGREDILSEITITLLKETYKPTFIIKNIPISFEKIAITSDDGIKINRSFFSFINNFSSIMHFNVLSYELEDSQFLLETLNYKGIGSKFMTYGSMESLYSAINQNSCLIMGNLSKSYFLKNITKRKGMDIIENTDLPIFIG